MFPSFRKSDGDLHLKSLSHLSIPKLTKYIKTLVIAMVGVEDIGVYIASFQNTVAQYIVTQNIMDLCLVVERNLGLRLSRRLWERSVLDILNIWTGNSAEKK